MNKTDGKVKKISLSGKDFWQKYQALVLKQGIQEDRAKWYVKWVYKFSHFLRGEPK